MAREVDLRTPRDVEQLSQRRAVLDALATELSTGLPPGNSILVDDVDAMTGNPARVVWTAPAGAVPAEDHRERAFEALRQARELLGLAHDGIEFDPEATVSLTSSGTAAVHAQQRYRGIDIFDAAQTVVFAPDGGIEEIAGTSVSVEDEPDPSPALTAVDAAGRAAEHVAEPDDDEPVAAVAGRATSPPQVDISDFVPTFLDRPASTPDSSALLDAGPFEEPIEARLVWFPIGSELRLAWEVVLTFPGSAASYLTLVEAQAGEVLYCRDLSDCTLARGSIYQTDGDDTRRIVDFPRSLSAFDLPIPGDLPASFPEPWVHGESTAGRTTMSFRFVPTPSGQQRVFARGVRNRDEILFFVPRTGSDDERVVNAFHHCCFMHNYFYLLAFRGDDGNLEGGDRVRVWVLDEPILASMRTPPTGHRGLLETPRMRLGTHGGTGRHTALDAGVIYHEYMHGVSRRLVGGPKDTRSNLDAPQSAGMNEGWSDYTACTVTDSTVIAAWLANNNGGLRSAPYTSNYPGDFGDLGTGHYRGPHDIGEVWCATLLEMNRRLGNKQLGIQLVVDAQKIIRRNPSFLHGRDAILAALRSMWRSDRVMTTEQYRARRRQIWAAFARFGMGPDARSDGATLSGIRTDFGTPQTDVTVPHVLQLSPSIASSQLRAVGLVPVLRGQGDMVGGQSPPAGEEVPRGSDVVLTLRSGIPH